VAQWGLIPPNSQTCTPTLPNGQRMGTNNARRELGDRGHDKRKKLKHEDD
jgi:hypothetical protein